MLPDITILRSGELMVAQIEAQNYDATEFIDAYSCADMQVVDSGRIILAEKDLDEFMAAAKFDGFKIEVDDAQI